jgi:hypothetical protein
MVYGTGHRSRTGVKILSNNKFPYDSSQEKSVKDQRFKGSGFKGSKVQRFRVQRFKG